MLPHGEWLTTPHSDAVIRCFLSKVRPSLISPGASGIAQGQVLVLISHPGTTVGYSPHVGILFTFLPGFRSLWHRRQGEVKEMSLRNKPTEPGQNYSHGNKDRMYGKKMAFGVRWD